MATGRSNVDVERVRTSFTPPAALQKHRSWEAWRIGHAQCMLMLKKIDAAAQKGDGRGFAAIVQSLGLPVAGSRVDEGWATGGRMDDPQCQPFIAGFSDIPWPVRNLCCILPKFVAQYEHLKLSLVSIATMTDAAHEIGKPPACGPCCCVVS